MVAVEVEVVGAGLGESVSEFGPLSADIPECVAPGKKEDGNEVEAEEPIPVVDGPFQKPHVTPASTMQPTEP